MRLSKLRPAFFALAALGSGLFGQHGPAVGATSLAADSLPLLTTVQQVRALAPEEAARGYPVRLRATVTGYGPSAGIFVIDGTGPIFLARESGPEGPTPSVGQVIEIEGRTEAGSYAPQVRPTRRQVVGHAPLPPPRRLNYEQMATGREDCQPAEIEGIVRATSEQGLTLAMGDDLVDVTCSVHTPPELARLVDARVRLRGVVCGRFNQKRQWFGVRFTVSTLDSIVVERPAPADPFAAPTHSIANLLQWELNQGGRHRVKVAGVVTHFQPGVALFLREGSAGLEIRTRETADLAPGDRVEALGFPALGTYSAVLEDAVFRRLERGAAPAPHPASTGDLLRGAWDASLVAVRGSLLQAVDQQGGHMLVMQAGDVVFHAHLAAPGTKLADLPLAGSELELTGIAIVASAITTGARLSPRVFSLLLRRPADIRTLAAPSLWTAHRLWQALAALSALALGILSWVWLLRRQVQAQTDRLTEKTQREAVLEERTRIAQELHDSLDQELTGISLQLNAATNQAGDASVGRRLEVIHRLVRRSQAEVRRAVWDLRRPAREPGGLGAALRELAGQLRDDSTAAVEVTVSGTPRPLAGVVEHHLLRIAAEAVTNAFRHASAGRIQVGLIHEAEAVRLRITDDGRGFDSAQAPGHASGHFGLIGMRERSRKIGGELTVYSRPGEGTVIELVVPHVRPGVRPSAGPHVGRSAPGPVAGSRTS